MKVFFAILAFAVVAQGASFINERNCSDLECKTCQDTKVASGSCVSRIHHNETHYYALSCSDDLKTISDQRFHDKDCKNARGKPIHFPSAQCHRDEHGQGSRTLVCVLGANQPVDPAVQGWRLIQSGPSHQDAKWVSPEDVEKMLEAWSETAEPGAPFMDITDFQKLPPVTSTYNNTRAIEPMTEAEEAKLSDILTRSEADPNLAYLTGHSGTNPPMTRRHNSADGIRSAVWMGEKMEEYCRTYSTPEVCSVRLFTHTRTPQRSVIGEIKGSNPNAGIVIIGAHLDSIAGSGINNRAPGADDDGSGTVTVMEAMRAILESGARPVHTIEFQLYAAEEVGLWGSADIAARYRADRVNVHSMIQFDMNGCCAPGRGLTRGTRFNVCIDEAFTDAALNRRLQGYITALNTLPQGTFRYGRAASDHASFARNGFAACHVKENVNYPPIHSANDRYENIDFEYLDQFVRVAIVHLRGEAQFTLVN